MEKKEPALRGKIAASTAYMKAFGTAVADEMRFQASEFHRNTEPLRIELRLMAMEHMEVVKRHSQPVVDALNGAIKAQVRATRARHRKEK
ncbi:MAG: hypothetical protein JRN26_06560 [Nitrososphaerota archaeon]|nr:hypothetical protein [Nitrososphaerota archaeon]MDG6936524.1 hypothetical protein [Nitrososphaerota archaeon]MDG6944999.1 hypothetical protein [Nitrososphaerota archaeon]